MPADQLPPFSTFISPASLFHSPISPLLFCCSLEPEWITCHTNNPPSLLLPISALLCRRTSLNKGPSYPSCLFLSFFPLSSHSIHGSFHLFNGLVSSVSVIANLIFPSLKTRSISLLGRVWQTWKRVLDPSVMGLITDAAVCSCVQTASTQPLKAFKCAPRESRGAEEEQRKQQVCRNTVTQTVSDCVIVSDG